MTLVAIGAAILVALPAYLAGRHFAGRRYQTLLSAAAEKHASNIDGLAAVIENLRTDNPKLKSMHVRAAAHLIWSAQEADSAGQTDVAAARRGAARGLLDALEDGNDGAFRVKKMTGEALYA